MGKHREPGPDERGRRDSEKHDYSDAWCTECHEWYNSSNQAEVNRHAH